MADRPLNSDQAVEILRPVWPDVVVEEVVPRTGGQLSTVYEVHCGQPAVAVIVKIYDAQWRWKLAKEVHVYGVLNQHGIELVPTILRAEHDTRVLGFAFSVMTIVPGQPLSHIAPRLDRADTIQIYRQLGAILSAIHRIRQDCYGYLVTEVVEPELDNTAYMTRQFSKKLREFRELGGDPELHDSVSRYVEPGIDRFVRCTAPVLCHNDFHEGNILVEHGPEGWKVTGFIDVENAIAADPLMDLAKTDYYSVQGNNDKLTGLLEGYGPLPDDWADRLALYRIYHALELWDWFASIGNTAPLPGIADDLRAMTERLSEG